MTECHSAAGAHNTAGTQSPKRRLSDRLHPIVVRDIKVALRSRLYGLTMSGSCLAVVVIAMLSVQRDHEALELSRWILKTSLACLVPIMLFMIPVQAFLSLRDETSSHTADQLVLTNLRPMSIILGMLQVALLQAVLFLAVFAPLIGFSYLLLAIDAYTLLQILWLLLFGCAASTGLGFALIYLTRWSFFREHLTLTVMIIVSVTPILIIANVDDYLLLLESLSRSGEFWLIAARQISMLVLLTTVLCLVGASCLTNFQENRAIIVRILGLAAAPALTLLAGSDMSATPVAALLTAPFWIAAVTDTLELGRRQKVLVPLSTAQARRMYILLPGSARGWIYSAVLAGIVFLTAFCSHMLFKGSLPSDTEAAKGLVGAGYIVLFAGAYCYARNHIMDQNRLATIAARMRLPSMTILFLMAHAVADGIISIATLQLSYFLTAPLNPVITFSPYGQSMLSTLLWQAAILLWLMAKNKQDLKSSWTEVMTLADRERTRSLEQALSPSSAS